MKGKNKGFTLVEMIIVVGIMTFITYSAIFMFTKTKEAHDTKEKLYVKRMMMSGGDPHQLSPNISLSRIDFYVKEILKENEVAVASGKENALPNSINSIIENTRQVTKQEIQQPIIEKEPTVVKQITENHYHFETLTAVLKYIGIGALSVLSLFSLIKLIMYTKQVITVKNAVRNSKKIVVNFDNNFDENKNYLPLLRNLSDQVIINSVLIENRKNKDSVLNLIVNNEQLKTRLNLMESNLMNKGTLPV